mgnify:CR=1 FL=1
MSYCEGQPKATEDDESSVAFINDTVNNKIDVKNPRIIVVPILRNVDDSKSIGVVVYSIQELISKGNFI